MGAEAATLNAIGPVQSRRFGLNLVSNVGNLGLTMVVGALYVPFLVRHLGPAVYGLVPLISTVTSYMSLVTVGLNYALGRSLTLALAREDQNEADSSSTVSFWSNVALSVMLVVPAAIVIAN